MEPIDGGSGSRAAAEAARRAAEEAARRAAEEARRQAAEEARREAARQRLIERNQRDGYETRPPATTFSPATTAVQASTAAATATPTYSPEEAARHAATTPAAPSLVSPQDESALARLAHRMGERGTTPEQIREAVTEARLDQIERDQQALASVDGAALEEQGHTLEAGAQAAVDHYIKNLDSIYSGLAPVDRDQAGYLAYLQDAQATGLTYEGVAVQTRVAGLGLEQAVLERQLAVDAGASPAALAALDTRIAEAQLLLDGNPTAAAQIEDLGQRIVLLDKNAELYVPNRPADWRAGYEQERAELQAELDVLRPQLPEDALLARLRDAQAAYDASTQRLNTQEGQLQATLADYRAGIDASVPLAQAGIEEFRTNVDLASASPELDQAVRALQSILPTATPEELGAALDRIEALPSGDIVLHRLQGGDGLLAADPRLRVLSGREIGVPQGLERFAQELILNTALLGIPSYLENRRILDAPGASPGLLDEARFGLALDYVGFALTLAGPVVDGISAVTRGGRTVVELTPQLQGTLRTAGYTDEAIAQIALRLNDAATSSRGLTNLLLRGSPEEAFEMLGLMRGGALPLEEHALRNLPESSTAVRQLAERPQEVLDFLVRSDAATVAAFRTLVGQGRSLDEARTIMTLARNGRSVDEVTAALAAGRSLDELVAETLFRQVGPQQAHELSGIPQTFLSGQTIEDIAALAQQESVDILVRDANQGLEATMAARWPKDPDAHFLFGGTEIKVASIPQQTERGLVRFKTDSSTMVGLEILDPTTRQWVPQDLFVVHRPEGWALVPGAQVKTMPTDWWAMGGDIDLLAVLERGEAGYELVPNTSARDVALRADLNAIATVPEGLPAGEVPGLFMHGSAYPYFNTNRGWTPALAFTSEGQMVWLNGDDAVEYWFKARGVPSEPYAHYSEAVSWLASRPIPFSSAGYLAGTIAGDLPEAMSALPDLTAGGAPTSTPGPPSTPDVTSPPLPPVPAPTAPTATPTAP